MRFQYYVNWETSLVCYSAKAATFCTIKGSTSTFYTSIWNDHPLISAIKLPGNTKVTYNLDMLRIITSLVLL